MENVDLADYVHYMVCDEKVIACGLEGGDVVVFDISTHQQLYVKNHFLSQTDHHLYLESFSRNCRHLSSSDGSRG